MADVSRVQGPSGPPEKPGRSARKVGSGFQDEMRRIEEVGKIDPDEAKKRKRPEETLREEELIRKAGAEPERKDVERTGKEFKVPSSESSSATDKGISTEGVTHAEESPSTEEALPTKREVEKERREPGKALAYEAEVRGFVSELEKRSGMEHMIKTREAEVQQGAVMPAAPETPEEEKQKAAAKGQDVAPITAAVSASGVEPTKVEEPTPEQEVFLPEDPPPPYTHLHPDVLDIFERLIGALVYLDQSGIKETTITIHSSEEKPSVFNGMQITIREYSTAPKEFNVELTGQPKAVELFQNNKKDLMDAFEHMPYTFKVKNIETSLQ